MNSNNPTADIIDLLLKSKDSGWCARSADFLAEASEYTAPLINDQGVVTGWFCPVCKMKLGLPFYFDSLG